MIVGKSSFARAGWWTCRLNYRLSTACHGTITEKCADACTSTSIEQPCGGTVLRCLSDKLDEITNEECKKEVFYFQKMEVRDFRNDVILAESCRADVDTYCPSIEAGPPSSGHACSSMQHESTV